MTLSETHSAIVSRIGWRNDNTVEFFDLSDENSTTDSGRVFQSEHSAVTLENIRDCQPVKKISSSDFNDYLENLRSDCVWQVLNDVFEKDYVDDDLLTLYPTAFDNCILLRMVINVSEMIMTSSRSNKIQRFTENFLGKLNYDIYRETVTKFANRVHYKTSMGISSRYNFELESCQRRFGNVRNMLKTVTKGQAHEPLGRRGFWDRFRN
jgi:hypothetical protein